MVDAISPEVCPEEKVLCPSCDAPFFLLAQTAFSAPQWGQEHTHAGFQKCCQLHRTELPPAQHQQDPLTCSSTW